MSDALSGLGLPSGAVTTLGPDRLAGIYPTVSEGLALPAVRAGVPPEKLEAPTAG